MKLKYLYVTGGMRLKMNGLDYHYVCPTVEFQAPVTRKNVIQTHLKDDGKHLLLKTFKCKAKLQCRQGFRLE